MCDIGLSLCLGKVDIMTRIQSQVPAEQGLSRASSTENRDCSVPRGDGGMV